MDANQARIVYAARALIAALDQPFRYPGEIKAARDALDAILSAPQPPEAMAPAAPVAGVHDFASPPGPVETLNALVAEQQARAPVVRPFEFEGNRRPVAAVGEAVAIPLELIPSDDSREAWRFSYPNGLTARQAANEISDYGFILEQVPKVYMHVTGGMLSKMNYHAHAVIGVADERQNEAIEDAVKEALEEARDESAAPPARSPLTPEQKNAMWLDTTIELASGENCYLRGVIDAERAHGIGILAAGSMGAK